MFANLSASLKNATRNSRSGATSSGSGSGSGGANISVNVSRGVDSVQPAARNFDELNQISQESYAADSASEAVECTTRLLGAGSDEEDITSVAVAATHHHTASSSSSSSFDNLLPLASSAAASSPQQLLERRPTALQCLIYFVDVLLSVVFFSPIVSLYWYGTWSFVDDYFMSASSGAGTASNLVSLALGLLVVLPGYLFQHKLQLAYACAVQLRRGGLPLRLAMRTVYIYLMSVAAILVWRSMWNLADLYFFTDWPSQLTMAIVSIAFFCVSRSTRTLVSTPFILFIDDYDNFFAYQSRHKIESVSHYTQNVVDFLICELMEGFASVLAWKGFDTLFDVYIYPHDKLRSLLTTLLVSHAIYLLIAGLQSFLFKRSAQMCLVLRLAVDDLVHLLMFLSAVLAWKFYWSTLDNYLKSEANKLWLYVVCHCCAFIVAVLLRVSGILVGPSTSFLDGEVTAQTHSTYFEISYLATLFECSIGRRPNIVSSKTPISNQNTEVDPV